MRRAGGIQACLLGSRWGGACGDEIENVRVADAVSDGRALLAMVILKAELIWATGTGGDDVVEYAVVGGSCGAGVAG